MVSSWGKKWGKNEKCSITLSRLRPGNNKFGIPYTICLPCKHRFYRAALINWVKTNPSCPVCRRRIFLIDLMSNKN